MTNTTQASVGDHADRLGPQTAALHAAADAAQQLRGDGPAALRFAHLVDADWRAIDAAEKRAETALAADGINAYAVYDLGSCVWGFAALALAARHLIGTTWTRADYDTLTRPWAAAIGPIHPADALTESDEEATVARIPVQITQRCGKTTRTFHGADTTVTETGRWTIH